MCSENEMAQKRRKIGRVCADDMRIEKRYTDIVPKWDKLKERRF